MLIQYWRYHELDLEGLFIVYEQSLQRDYGGQNDFSEDLYSFFCESKGCLVIWKVQETAVAAVRCEPYQDGYLISCMETALAHRRKGYAYEMLSALFAAQPGMYYAHVDKRNKASLALHKKLGFTVFLNHAVHVDGSVYANSYTLRK